MEASQNKHIAIAEMRLKTALFLTMAIDMLTHTPAEQRARFPRNGIELGIGLLYHVKTETLSCMDVNFFHVVLYYHS